MTEVPSDPWAAHDFRIKRDHVVIAECRASLRLWFWVVINYSSRRGQFGWTDAPQSLGDPAPDSMIAAALAKLAPKPDTHPIIGHNRVAYLKLREIHRNRRKMRPPRTGTQESSVTAFLYVTNRSGTLIAKHRVVRISQKLVFYDKTNVLKRASSQHPDDIENGILHLSRLDQEERWSAYRWSLTEPSRQHVNGKDGKITAKMLKELRATMLAAHPDAGGTDEAFVAAYSRYEEARRRAEAERKVKRPI